MQVGIYRPSISLGNFSRGSGNDYGYSISLDSSNNVYITGYTGDSTTDAPVTFDGSLETNEDTPANGQLNASDLDGDDLTYSIVANPTNGDVTDINASTGAFTYEPDLGYYGPDSFTFKVNDGVSNSNTATVSITVNEVIVPPSCGDGTCNGAETCTTCPGDCGVYY